MEDKHNIEQTAEKSTRRWSLTITCIIGCLIFIGMVVAGYCVGYHVGSKITPVNTTPETGVNDILESTSAPDEPSIPVTEESIPETTEVEVTEPTVTTPETQPTTPPATTPHETPSEPVKPETKPNNSLSEREMLACVIYQEAGSDAVCDDCRRRVADVVLNRVAHESFPDTMYEVLTAPRQYGRYHWTGIVWPSRASHSSEQDAVDRAYRIADEVLAGQHSELYGQGYIWQAEFRQGKEQIKCCGIYFGR